MNIYLSLGENIITKRINPIPIIHLLSSKPKIPNINIIPYPIIPRLSMTIGKTITNAIFPPKFSTKKSYKMIICSLTRFFITQFTNYS